MLKKYRADYEETKKISKVEKLYLQREISHKTDTASGGTARFYIYNKGNEGGRN